MVPTLPPIIPMLPSSSSSSSSAMNTQNCSNNASFCSSFRVLNPRKQRVLGVPCGARRRVRYEEDGEEDEDGDNEEIAMLEVYSQSARGEALIVHAVVDEEQVEVLIFKGFSSCLSYGTSPDPTKSILPERAVIKSIDRIKGPFDPSNIEYLEKGLTWEAFKHKF
ncbi:uncharacterized protein G2W53_035343 [Senna tora]|uniref:DUF7734 domain-containing protein n=1 Tax=Senna tora TaxID=362788 RepID=A0A834SQ78_9FABA|nr:uncharacterized protein G2W53_035343 [Senna tora]